MNKLTSRLTLVVCVMLALVFQLAATPPPAEARWHSNAPEPGADLTPYLIAGGLVIAGAVVYAVVNKSNDTADENAEETLEEKSSVELNAPSLCLLSEQTSDSASDRAICAHDLSAYPYIDVDLETLERRQFVSEMTDMTIRAGIALAF